MRAPVAVALLATLLTFVPPGLGSGIEPALPCAATVGSGTSANLHTVAERRLGPSYGELVVRGTLLYAAAHNTGGFDVFDISTVTNPVRIAAYRNTPAPSLDVKLSADGLTAFVGKLRGLDLVDVSNPAAPVRIRQITMPVPQVDMGHMIWDHVIGGSEYVFAATQSGNGVYVYKLTGATPATRNLQFLARFAPGSPLGAHDMWVTDDPLLGKPVMYVSNGFAGWLAADVSNPGLPVPLAVFPNPDAHQGYLHSTQASIVNGRRLVATMEEIGVNVLRVWDATVLTAPVLVAEWTANGNPAPLVAVPDTESQHNIQIVDGRLYMAHYSRGFFVFDLAALPPLPVVGAPAPSTLAPVAHWAVKVSGGSHWDVVLQNGLVFTSDYHSDGSGGLYVVQFGCITVGDAGQTSQG